MTDAHPPDLSDDDARAVALGATAADLPARFELRPAVAVVDPAQFLESLRLDLLGVPGAGIPPLNRARGLRNARDLAPLVLASRAARGLPPPAMSLFDAPDI